MSRGKVSAEARLAAAKVCAEGRMSQCEAARRMDGAVQGEHIIASFRVYFSSFPVNTQYLL